MAEALSDVEALQGRRLVEQSERAARLDEVTAEIGIMRLQQSGLESQLSSQTEKQASVYAYLQKKWLDSSEQLAALAAKVAAEEAALVAKRERVGAEAAEAAQRDGVALSEAQGKVDALEAERRSLERFADEKAVLAEKCEKLQETVDRRRKAHAESLEMLDQKNQIEGERLQAEMEMRIGETTRSIEAHAKAKLPDSTKRTMMDIEKIGTELDYQNHEVKKLRERCDKIDADNAKLKAQLMQARREEAAAARRLHQRQREHKRVLRDEKAAAADAAAEEEKGNGGGGGDGGGRRGKGGERGGAASSAKRRRNEQARQQQQQQQQQAKGSSNSDNKKNGASGGGGGNNNEALLERLLAQLEASERQAAELEPQQAALTADLDRLLLAQDKLTQVVLAAVKDALGDPSVLRQVAARLQHKQRQQNSNNYHSGNNGNSSYNSSSSNNQQSQYADNKGPERRDSADDSLSWVSDDNTVASSAALSLGDLSSLTAAGGQLFYGGGGGAAGFGGGGGSKQLGSSGQSRQLRYVAAEHLEAPQRWHVLGLVLARVHNLQLEGIAAASAAAGGGGGGKGKGDGDGVDAPESESSLPAIIA